MLWLYPRQGNPSLPDIPLWSSLLCLVGASIAQKVSSGSLPLSIFHVRLTSRSTSNQWQDLELLPGYSLSFLICKIYDNNIPTS